MVLGEQCATATNGILSSRQMVELLCVPEIEMLQNSVHPVSHVYNMHVRVYVGTTQ